jgi:hypothetical protein
VPVTETIDFQGIQLTKVGTWAGTAKYRVLCGSRKIYPEEYEGDVEDGVYQILNEPLVCTKGYTLRVQFRSSDDGDQGPNQAMKLNKISKRRMWRI